MPQETYRYTVSPHIPAKQKVTCTFKESIKHQEKRQAVKSVNQFIDDLIEGFETKFPESHVHVNIGLALQKEYKCPQ